MASTTLEDFMDLAIEEALTSLRTGNSGFGALILRNGRTIARAHDTDTTDGDPTAHAELKAIRSAAATLGKDLSSCVLVSTHEPCPMCAAAALWAGIREIAFGYPIAEAIGQGRKRIDLSVQEIFQRAGKTLTLHEKIRYHACSILYDRSVREHVRMLRGAGEKEFRQLAAALSRKRRAWFAENYHPAVTRPKSPSDYLEEGYRLFLSKLDIAAEAAPVVTREQNRLVIHSKNFCPTLEACRILNLDTRFVCRHLTENPTTDLLRQVHPFLKFTRNYEKIRPYSDYCEEMILFEG